MLELISLAPGTFEPVFIATKHIYLRKLLALTIFQHSLLK